MKKLFLNKGFTLIELVMVIVILGILAVVAVPKFIDITSESKDAATAGVVGGVRSGIGIAFATHTDGSGKLDPAYPSHLDAALASSTCGPTNAFFDSVLSQGGITDDTWSKGASADIYNAPNGDEYTYTSSNGNFLKTN